MSFGPSEYNFNGVAAGRQSAAPTKQKVKIFLEMVVFMLNLPMVKVDLKISILLLIFRGTICRLICLKIMFLMKVLAYEF